MDKEERKVLISLSDSEQRIRLEQTKNMIKPILDDLAPVKALLKDLNDRLDYLLELKYNLELMIVPTKQIKPKLTSKKVTAKAKKTELDKMRERFLENNDI